MKNIFFLGGGNMCAALLSGLRKNPDFKPFVAEKNAARRAVLHELFALDTAENLPRLEADDVLILAVKPQDAKNALTQVSLDGSLVLSVVAGMPCALLSSFLHGHRRLIRVMPNTPAGVGEGMAGLFACDGASEADRSLAEIILTGVGKIMWLADEDELHAVTAVSGSGPAYVFYFMNALFRAALRQGLSPEAAKISVVQTFLGSARLAGESDSSFAELQQKVTSKGGTTFAALQVFDRHNLSDTIIAGVDACAARSREMAQNAGDES